MILALAMQWWTFRDEDVFNQETVESIHTLRVVASGVHGQVYSVNDRPRYLLKVMTGDDPFQFDTEVGIGMLPGIERSGVRVHAYTTTAEGTKMYIMDHAAMGRADVVYTMPVTRYLVDVDVVDPAHFDRVLKTTLKRFYVDTQGFHGDLHGNNVMVNLDKHFRIVNMRVIDYGAFVPFVDFRARNNDDIDEILTKGDRNVKSKRRVELLPGHFWPKYTKIQLYKRSSNDEFFRSNRNMLEQLTDWKTVRKAKKQNNSVNELVAQLLSERSSNKVQFKRKRSVSVVPNSNPVRKVRRSVSNVVPNSNPVRNKSVSVVPNSNPVRNKSVSVVPNSNPVRNKSVSVVPNSNPVRNKSVSVVPNTAVRKSVSNKT